MMTKSETDNNSLTTLTVTVQPMGGYVVSSGDKRDDYGFMKGQIACFTHMVDAMGFIAQKIIDRPSVSVPADPDQAMREAQAELNRHFSAQATLLQNAEPTYTHPPVDVGAAAGLGTRTGSLAGANYGFPADLAALVGKHLGMNMSIQGRERLAQLVLDHILRSD